MYKVESGIDVCKAQWGIETAVGRQMLNDSVAEIATVDNVNPILHSKQTG